MAVKTHRIVEIDGKKHAVCVERDFIFVPEEPAPEGWRSGHTVFDGPNSDILRFWTNAPKGEFPHSGDYEQKWIRERRIIRERYVSEWQETDLTFDDYMERRYL